MLDRSPWRNASGGTICDRVASNGRRPPSYVAKKNVRLRTIGPPAVAPAVFALTSGLIGRPFASRGANWSTLANLLFWLNQNADPCSLLVPLLVVVVMSVACMYSALFPAAVTLNSSIDSTDGNRSRIGPPPRVFWTDTPSTEKDVM